MTRLSVEHLFVPVSDRMVLKDISFAAQSGTLVGLVGPNGAGKSTLAKALIGLLPPESGTIRLDKDRLDDLSRREVARRFSYMAQGDALHWPLAARSTVALGRAPHLGRLGARSTQDEEAIDRAMARADVREMADRDVKRLSGGERARVLLARALAVEAPVLIADEPVGSLDPRHALRIMALLREEAAHGVLVIAVLHDLALASRFCDRLLVLNEGRLVADGPPHQVLSPEGIERHYQVSGYHGKHGAERFVIPWQALGEA